MNKHPGGLFGATYGHSLHCTKGNSENLPFLCRCHVASGKEVILLRLCVINSAAVEICGYCLLFNMLVVLSLISFISRKQSPRNGNWVLWCGHLHVKKQLSCLSVTELLFYICSQLCYDFGLCQHSRGRDRTLANTRFQNCCSKNESHPMKESEKIVQKGNGNVLVPDDSYIFQEFSHSKAN